MDGIGNNSKPAPMPEVTIWLSEVLTQIEDAGAWDDGCVLRNVVIEEYGLAGLQQIERYGETRAIVAVWAGDAWIYAPDPWRTAKEAIRRKNDIRRTMRGEYSPAVAQSDG